MNILDEQERGAVRDSSAFDHIMPTGGFKRVANILIIIFVLILSILVFVPWQQTISGVGSVRIYSPMDRPQTVEAPIEARIDQWHVKEGEKVKAGKLLVELAEIDPKFLDPEQLARLRSQREQFIAQKDAVLSQIEALKAKANSLRQSQQAAVPAAQVKVSQTKNKILAAQQGLTAAKQDQVTAELNLTRIQELHEKGLRSTRDLELARQKLIETQTKVEQAEAYLQVARQDQDVASLDQLKVAADTEAYVTDTQASIAKSYELLGKINSQLLKLEVDVKNLERRVEQRTVLAPKSGIVVRISDVGPGGTVKKGDILVTLMPESADQAVELLISDNDAPLVAVGRPVRLQFAGWPALQFSGWPAVAVGTFAGRVAVVDAVDDGTSRYRVWVKPDEEAVRRHDDEPWPSVQYLRPGSQALGWIMLDTVPLWFELWRQFNAFPPTVSPEEYGRSEKNSDPFAKDTDIKKPKMIK